ncbi:MAG: cell wall-associated NlpC family hydrolase [Myxococcota bacterium]|jgi:cell wall-associated NlpC family hydrolase
MAPLSLLMTAVLLAGPVPPSPPKLVVDKVWIALGEGPQGPASNKEMRVKLNTDVRLYLVVEARVDGKRKTFTEAPALRKGRRTVKNLAPWPKALGKLDVAWFKLEADPLDNGVYDNTGTMEKAWHPVERQDHPARWHWCPIDYVESELEWHSAWQGKADAKPTTTTDYKGLGTMRYVARVRYKDPRGRKAEVWSPGKGHRDKAGLKRGIATVRFRRDDTPVGYMTELLNVPYVYGSSSLSGGDRNHQAERGVGADCADLVVYGWRRAGKKSQGYTWTGGLKTRSKRRVWVTSLENGRYRDGEGKPIAFGKQVRVGDMLLWDRHVAVLATRDPSGYLTPDTEIIHTVIESAALIPLRQIGFGFDTPPFDIRRAKWEKK